MTVSPQKSETYDGPGQKQKINVYTMMLIISFFAILTSCILLYMELQQYGAYPWWNTSGSQPSSYHFLDGSNSAIQFALSTIDRGRPALG